jgi:spoIIIJ-associated protein
VKTVRANTLEEAYKEASSQMGVSVVDLDIEIVQSPSAGFLGMFKKEAIVNVYLKGEERVTPSKAPQVKKEKTTKKSKVIAKNETSIDANKIKYEIKEGLNRLLDASCFNVDLVELRVTEDEVYIKLDGEDVALMIGKEGYRYKALSYILHNWIKIKYNLNISLEIAEFLKNQEEMIEKYLIGIKEKIDTNGKAQTKPLDGILVKIALGELRAVYPDKYVAIRTLRDGRKIVVVNEFRKAEQ